MPVIASHNCHNPRQLRKNQAESAIFSSVYAAFCQQLVHLRRCGQGRVPSYCCSAVSRSLIAKPPPFLGVSSLNLAALRSGHFFCPDLLVSGFVARSLAYSKVRVAPRSCPATKIAGAKQVTRRKKKLLGRFGKRVGCAQLRQRDCR